MTPDQLIDDVAPLAFFEMLRLRLVRTVPVATPAVGTEWSQVVPAGVIWELLSVTFQLVTSAVVANRNVATRVQDADGTLIARFGPAGASPASVTGLYTNAAGYGISLGSVGFQASLPSPPVLALSGWQVRSTTAGIDAGDQFGAIVLTVREWSPAQVAQQLAWLSRQLIATEIST